MIESSNPDTHSVEDNAVTFIGTDGCVRDQNGNLRDQDGNVRLTQAKDITGFDVSRGAQQAWYVACDRRGGRARGDKVNRFWAKIETIAKEMHVHERTAQRAMKELCEKHLVCRPFGNRGGRKKGEVAEDRAKGNATVYHLHADGKPCGLAQETDNLQSGRKGVKLSPYPTEHRTQQRVTIPPAKGDILSGKGDISSSAYKEVTSSENLFREPLHTHTDLDRNVRVTPTEKVVPIRANEPAVTEAVPQSALSTRLEQWMGEAPKHWLMQELHLAGNGISESEILELLVCAVARAVDLGKQPRSWKWFPAALANEIKSQARAERLSRRSSKQSSEPFVSPEEVRRYLLGCAAGISRLDIRGASRIARLLEERAAQAEAILQQSGWLDSLEGELSAMEEELTQQAASRIDQREAQAIEEIVARDLRPYASKMPSDQLAALRSRYWRSQVMATKGIPRLSLFYMA